VTIAVAEITDLLNEAEAAHRAGDHRLAMAKVKAAMVHGMDKLRTELKDIEETRPKDAEDWYVYLAQRMGGWMTKVHTNRAPKLARQAEEVGTDG
jgi:hypothetical protein